jgi:hypothetical protein
MVLLLRRANLASALRFRFKLTSNFHISHSNWEKRKVIKPFLLADIGEGITGNFETSRSKRTRLTISLMQNAKF